MKIPYPESPAHVDNLSSISLLETQKFEGVDASLPESLFEYGIAWRAVEDETLFIHHHSSIEGKFDRTSFKSNLDFESEFNWVDWESFLGWVGETKENWQALPFGQKISDLVNHYGVESIFGTSYWEGFSISED